MDLKSSKYLEAHGGAGGRKKNRFVDGFLDPLSKLNLKETSDFVKSFPMAKKDGAVNKRNVVEAPTTPGRPVFSFSVGNNGLRNNFVPSKWNDAEKWLVSGHDYHHLHGFVKSADFVSKQSSDGFVITQQHQGHHQTQIISEKSGVTEEKVTKAVSVFQDRHHHNSARAFNGISATASSYVQKDKYANEVKPNFLKFKYSEPTNEGFLFGDSSQNSMVDAGMGMVHEVKSRDIGTEMTPLGSSTPSRCPTPFKSLSPPRHNTPADRSGPLSLMDPSSSFDIGKLQECHLAKLQLGTPFDSVASNWSSREEEEEDISKSLRHFEMNNEFRRSISEPRACAWEEEKIKCCLRYQREEAKIQAWVNLQNAKAEAQSRKLEVKIQRMRSKFEEKLMRKTAIVHRKAEELRAAAQLEHTEQIGKVTEQAEKMMKQHQSIHFSVCSGSCGCFSCNNLHP